LLGGYLVNAKHDDAAIAEFQTALSEDPKLADARVAMAKVYFRQGKNAQAAEQLDEALAQKPDYVPALMARGSVADDSGDRAEAIRCYQRVLDANPNNAAAANNLAWDYAMENVNLDQALDLAELARRQDPRNPHVADTLGFIMLKRGVSQAAVPYLREGVAGIPDSESAHYHLGLALLATNQPNEAMAELKTALKLAPESSDVDQINHALSRANEQMRALHKPGRSQPG